MGENWEALGRAVKQRRESRRLPQDLIDRGGPGAMTMRKIEQAETTAIRPKTKSQLEFALGWPPGYVDRILDGTSDQVEIDQPITVTLGTAVAEQATVSPVVASTRKGLDDSDRVFLEALDRHAGTRVQFMMAEAPITAVVGGLMVRLAQEETPTPATAKLLDAALAWMDEHTEKARQGIRQAGE